MEKSLSFCLQTRFSFVLPQQKLHSVWRLGYIGHIKACSIDWNVARDGRYKISDDVSASPSNGVFRLLRDSIWSDHIKSEFSLNSWNITSSSYEYCDILFYIYKNCLKFRENETTVNQTYNQMYKIWLNTKKFCYFENILSLF